jgi:DNA-binding PadR family transcriptional regulator
VPQPLPLTDLAFNLLVALADEELHGYALVKRLRELEGRADLRTGTVYAALARLQDEGWVEDAEPPADQEDQRRRYYRLTAEGRKTARAEADRLAQVLRLARAKELLEDPAVG